MILLVALLYETILRCDLCDIKLYMTDPTDVRLEGFGILFIPLSDNFSWMSVYVIIIVCLCYHNDIIIATTRIMYAYNMMEIVPCVPMLPSWIIIPLVVCNSMAVI